MAWYVTVNRFYESHEVESEVKTETVVVLTVSSSANTHVVPGGDGGTA
jgi:hypothetical protein